MTGTYPFQGSRATYSNISPICELCGENDETLEHFLLECKLLYAPRSEHLSIISDILASFSEISFDNLDSEIKVQMPTDCTKLRSTSIRLSRIVESADRTEFSKNVLRLTLYTYNVNYPS